MMLEVALAALLVDAPEGAAAEPAATHAAPDLRTARAAGAPSDVSLDLQRCPALPRDEMLRLVALELGSRVAEPGHAPASAARVAIACDGPRVNIAVSEPAQGASLRRATVYPPEREEIIGRLVALAVSELVLANRTQRSFGEAPPIQTGNAGVEQAAPASPSAADAAAAGPSSGALAYVLLLGQALGPFTGVGMGLGGGLRLGLASRGRAVGSWGRLGPAGAVDFSFARTQADSTLGQTEVSLWSATLRPSLRLRRGRAWLDVGGGARFGLAHLEGRPRDPAVARGATVAGTWAGPIAYAGVGAAFSRVAVELGVEGGYVLRAVRGLVDDGAPVSISGGWACGSVAVGWGE